ncbi:MAG: hypothetical protein J6M90_00020 [Oscillospiraceae bacterium]|nr:hypothetical protein [Oscillospiraceae bacterium]MBQ9208132.1 hypothetical protein [Oscillospiraceae bacterium]
MEEYREYGEAIADEELSAAIAERTAQMRSDTLPPAPAKSDAKGHRARVRERFLKSGLTGFAPHEVLELLLFYVIPYRDTKKTAHELINRFGSVSGVFNADISELVKVPLITENAAALFKLIPPLIEMYYSEESKGISYTDTASLAAMFRPYFVGAGQNKFVMCCFDNTLRLISAVEISRGGSACTTIEIRRIIAEAINSGCCMAALAHNHPGASPKPSEEDVELTRKISSLLEAVDVKLMDHIIIGGASTYSMREGGELGILD